MRMYISGIKFRDFSQIAKIAKFNSREIKKVVYGKSWLLRTLNAFKKVVFFSSFWLTCQTVKQTLSDNSNYTILCYAQTNQN